MFKFIIQRSVVTLFTAIGVSFLSFFVIYAIPGDPVDVILGDMASALDKAQLRKELGLDLSIFLQFKEFILKTFTGDLGTSYFSGRSVSHLILERLPATLSLGFFAMLMAMAFAIPLGVYSAVMKGKAQDRIMSLSSMILMSLPVFYSGPILIWFLALKLGAFPAGGRDGALSIFLPALSLALPLGAILFRMTRASMLEVLSKDYMTSAWAKGCSWPQIYMVHGLKNALIPVITILGLQFGTVLTGTVITETIFNWPGLGTLLFEAIGERDYPIVQACVLVTALVYVGINFITDILYSLAQPKMREMSS